MTRHTRKSNSRSVDDRGHNLLQRTKLLSDTRLEIERKLELGNCRHHVFPVLSGSSDSGAVKLGPSENFRTEINASDQPTSDMLERGPILSREQHLAVDPIRDGLLADGRPIHELCDTVCQGSLATGDLDSPSKRSNVRFIHNHAGYTNGFVRVNQPVCVTQDKSACIVLPMRSTLPKPAHAPKKSAKRVAKPGPDGKTLGQRLAEAMAHESGRRGRVYTQKELMEDVNREAGVQDGDPPFLSQQNLSAIVRGTVSRSSFIPFIAKACHVSAPWLLRGTGSMLTKTP